MSIFEKKVDVKSILAEQDRQIVDLKRSIHEKDIIISSLELAVTATKQKKDVSSGQVKRLKRKVERQVAENMMLLEQISKLNKQIEDLTQTAKNSKERSRRLKNKLDKIDFIR